MKAETEKRIIFVAGMHRSGTSALTRFINLCGPALPANLVPASPENNSLGFWEPLRLVEINNALFARLEMVWHSTGPMPRNWSTLPALDDLRADAGEFIGKLNDECVVLKDPRLCRLLPFWKEILNELRVPSHVLIPYRSPLEVSLSLGQRDKFAQSKALLLWLRYNIEAEINSRVCASRAFVSFDELLAAPRDVHSQLVARLADLRLHDWSTVEKDVQAFLQPEAKHFNIHPGGSKRLDPVIDAVFSALSSDEDEMRLKVDNAVAEFAALDRLAGPQLNVQEWEQGKLRRKISRMQQREHRSADGQNVADAEAQKRDSDKVVGDMESEILDGQTRLRCLLERLACIQSSIETRLDSLEQHSAVEPIESVAPNPRIDGRGSEAPDSPQDNADDGHLPEASSLPRLVGWRAVLAGPLRLFRQAFGGLDWLRKQAPDSAHIADPEAQRLRAEAGEIADSDWFDEDWYLEMNTDVAQAGMDPARHFVEHGWREGRDPSPAFSVTRYLEAYPDVKEKGGNPLLHFIRFGRCEGRRPRPHEHGRASIGAYVERIERGGKAESAPRPPPDTGRAPRRGRVLVDLNGNRVTLDPVPAFSFRDYELTPRISGPVLMLPMRRSQFPEATIQGLDIAVHVHLHHADLAGEFAEYLANVPIPFRLYVSVTDGGSLDHVTKTFRNACVNATIEVRVVPNRGRDIASLVTEFSDELIQADLCAHFHSKRSIHNPAKADWRLQLLHSLLGSPELVSNIFSFFRFNPQVGMVFPEFHWSLEKQISWGRNFSVCSKVAERTGITVDSDRLALFPAGSMFWARPDALARLLDADIQLDEFPPEEGQVDGTLAHAIERLFGEYVVQAGYQLRQIKPDRQHSLRSYYTSDWPYPLSGPDEEKRRAESYREANKGRRNRIAVYTAIAGGYDTPLVHETLDPAIDYYLFTDRPMPDRGFWRVRSIDFHHPDPVRKARYVKTHPHTLLEGYDLAIWIDANVLVRCDLRSIVESAHEKDSVCIYGVPHPHRQCVFQEADILKDMAKDLPDMIERQVHAYKDQRFPRNSGLIETNLLVSNLREPGLAVLMRRWWGEIVRYSHRDQMSINFVVWSTGATFKPLLGEGVSLRSHPGFAYFAHGSDSGLDRTALETGTVEPLPVRRIAALAVSAEHGDRPAVDVVVCVHDALDDVKACLRSLLQARSAHDRIVLVDDASGPATAEFLDDFAQTNERVTVLRNESSAVGYCRAANIGLRASRAKYVLLLNSDTIVPRRAVDKLVRAMESSDDIALAGPLSNAASTQSVPDIRSGPEQTAVNELPPGATAEDVDNWCAEEFLDFPYPRVPLVHGFCQMIRTSILAEVGYFDEISFPEGYGEENDFCFRAAETGYELVVSIDTFVFHCKSASYSDSARRASLMSRGSRALRERYGQKKLAKAIKAMETHPLLQTVRARARDAWYAHKEPE